VARLGGAKSRAAGPEQRGAGGMEFPPCFPPVPRTTPARRPPLLRAAAPRLGRTAALLCYNYTPAHQECFSGIEQNSGCSWDCPRPRVLFFGPCGSWRPVGSSPIVEETLRSGRCAVFRSNLLAGLALAMVPAAMAQNEAVKEPALSREDRGHWAFL